MSLDRLLLWLSAKGQGSWSQFRGAVEALCVEQDYEAPEITDNIERDGSNGSDLPVYQRCRFALQRLGHVEFFSNEAERGWRVVPPAVALLSTDSGEGVLCGARFSGLLERLDRVDDLDVTRTDAVGMPQRIVIRGNSQSVAPRRIAVRPPSSGKCGNGNPVGRARCAGPCSLASDGNP